MRLRPSRPAAFSSCENFARQTTIHTANAASGIHSIGPMPVTSCSTSAMPPISAAIVMRLMKKLAPRFASPARGPSRSRMISKVARPLTAATRPDMFANTQMPTTPTATTHASDMPKREPTTAFVTRSPMSTKPPIAVSTPRATAKSFFIRRPSALRGPRRVRPTSRPSRRLGRAPRARRSRRRGRRAAPSRRRRAAVPRSRWTESVRRRSSEASVSSVIASARTVSVSGVRASAVGVQLEGERRGPDGRDTRIGVRPAGCRPPARSR